MPPRGPVYVKATAAEIRKKQKEAVLSSLKQSTQTEYMNMIRHLNELGLTRDFDGIRQLILLREPCYALNTIEKYMSAINKVNTADFDPSDPNSVRPLTTTEYAVLHTMAKGRIAAEGVTVRERGGINEAMLHQLVGFMRKKGAPDTLIFATKLCFATSAREDSMDKLTLKNFRQQPGSRDWYLEVPKDHDPHAQMRGQAVIERRKIHAFFQQELDHTLGRLRQLQSVDTPVVGEYWNAPVLRSFIKRAAAHFNWDWRLEWVIHSLRHGSAQTAIAAGENIQGFTGQASAAVAAHYGRSNDDRVESIQRQRSDAASSKAGAAGLAAALEQPVDPSRMVQWTIAVQQPTVGQQLHAAHLRKCMRRQRE